MPTETVMWMEAMSFEYVVEGILLFIVGLIGIVANAVALIIFMEKRTHIFYRWVKGKSRDIEIRPKKKEPFLKVQFL